MSIICHRSLKSWVILTLKGPIDILIFESFLKPSKLRITIMLKPFFRVVSLDEAKAGLQIIKPLGAEFAELDGALFRVLAESIKADQDSPAFDRATMDGYAVRSIDSFGSTESSPSLFNVVGEVSMGEFPKMKLKRGEAVKIWTGGVLPANADSVVMIEYAEELGGNALEVLKAVAPFDNMVRRGEDYRRGEVLLNAGLRLRPQDLGLLASLGTTKVKVHRSPKVALISSGDEIVPANQTPPPGCVRDVNRHSLFAGIREVFAQPIWVGLAADTLKSVSSLIRSGLEQSDVVIISGGSSMGSRDYVIQAISDAPDSKILAHGISMSPGKPLILGLIDSKPVVGLPGHPISALVCFDQLVVPIIRRLAGEVSLQPFLRPQIRASLTRNVASKEGRLDFVRVKLSRVGDEYLATPFMAKSGMVSAMPRSHAYLKIPVGCEGYYKGRTVTVYLFSNWMGDDFEKEYFSGDETAGGGPGNLFGASGQEKLSGIGTDSHS